jgi:serine/threonine-protein kinase
MIPLLGKVLNNRFRVEEHIGRGGMAEVYRAYDQQRGAYLALKVLRDDLAEDKIFISRFEREARILAELQHPHIVRFYGFQKSDGYVYILMDFIQGKTLRKLISQKDAPLDENKILDILDPVCKALHFAHKSGRVHCDVKSANIMIKDS